MNFETQHISFENTQLFSKLFLDYVHLNETVKDFYQNDFTQQGFERQLKELNYNEIDRNLLFNIIQKQALLVSNTTPETKTQIEKIKNKNTFCVTTGHQLCLFTGPMYFIYKIITAINTCKTLNETFNEYHFLPVFWMASEDHDFEEINHFNVFNKKIEWKSSCNAPVGRLTLNNFEAIYDEFSKIIGNGQEAAELLHLFKKTYLEHQNLALATRFLINALFGKYGLIVIDGDDRELKNQFINEFKDDILNETLHTLVQRWIIQNEKNYKTQANPKACNVFYMEDGIRKYIEKVNDNTYAVKEIGLTFSKKELEHLLETQPEKFSPNVLLRTLYQQKVLPNIAYVGGAAEIQYWLELKNVFDYYNISYPILIPRHHALLIDQLQLKKMQKLNFKTVDFFKAVEQLKKEFIINQPDNFSFEAYDAKLIKLFLRLETALTDIDTSLKMAVKAELTNTMTSVDKLKQKAVKAQKQKHELALIQIDNLKQKLFPQNKPQERYVNFAEMYLQFGNQFIEYLVTHSVYNFKIPQYNVLAQN